MNKRILLVIVMMVAIFISGCFTKDLEGEVISTNNDNDNITIRFINSWGGVDSNAKALENILTEFMEENQQITVINDSVGGGGFLEKLKADFATNNDPDVFGLWPGSDMNALIQAGKVADLTEIINADSQWESLFGDDAWSYSTVDDKIYGLPVELIYEALFINKEMFELYNLEPPQTYEDLKALIIFFNDEGIIPIAYNYEAEGTYIYQNLVAQLGGRAGVEDIELCYKVGMEKMLELYNMGTFPENAYRISNTQRNDLFLHGEAAMIVQGSWFTREIYSKGMGAKVEIVPFPSFADIPTQEYYLVYGLGSGNFFMSQKAWNDPNKRQACLELLKMLTSPRASKLLSYKSGFISNIDMSSILRHDSLLSERGHELINEASQLVPPPDSIIDRALWESIIVEGLPDIYRNGEAEIENLWSRISEGN